MADKVTQKPFDLKNREYAFFAHKNCEFFPCHKTENIENFNCLFCYCPLYFLGEECGGNFLYTANGVKDCEVCGLPHLRENYDLIVGKLGKAIDKRSEE
jgi:Zn-finger protein